jgi:AcrR family transcriptional regulator
MSSRSIIEPTSRDRVLSAAQQLMIDHGFADFSMRELAEVSGLAKATIYHHFPDKQTICHSVIESQFVDLRDRIIDAAQSADSPVERLRAVVDELLGPQLERRLVVLLAAQETVGLGMHFHDIIKRYRSEIVAPIADIVQDGIDKGVFRQINVDLAVISLMGMMQSYITHRLIISPDQQLDNIVEHTIDLLLYGISEPI